MYKNMNKGKKSTVSNLHTKCDFKNTYLTEDHHTGSKWLIHGPERRKED